MSSISVYAGTETTVAAGDQASKLKLCQDGFIYFANASKCVLCSDHPLGPPPAGAVCNGTDDAYPCPRGHYCPTYASWLPCREGAICREGSISPHACFGGALTCGQIGMAACDNVVPAVALFVAFFVLLWVAIHVFVTVVERFRERRGRLRFEATSRTIHDYMIVFPYAMRWRRKTLVRRKRKELRAQMDEVLSSSKESRASSKGSLPTTSLSSDYPAADGNSQQRSVSVTTLTSDSRDKSPSISSLASSTPSILEARESLRHLAAMIREVTMAAETAEAFADIPRSRAFRHALRQLDERPIPRDAVLRNVCVAADPKHAARIKADRSGKERPIVKDVSCVMRAGRFTAIMGPSGCGKSTLLKALAAAGEGPQFVSGEIDVGGERRELSRPLPDACFMPQESVIYPDLSGDESIKYARLLSRGPFFAAESPEGGQYDATDELVDEVMDVLGLGCVRGRLVGAEDNAEGALSAVSGGQRRRIVLAMEIVKRPSTLLLDEPTTGLDSTSSLVTMRALRDLANNGTSVIAVIHQPGYRVFKMVDDLVLLTAHGTLAYNGDAEGVLSYLESIEYPRPIHASIPEFALDVAVGLARRRGAKVADGAGVASEFLTDKWKTRCVAQAIDAKELAKRRKSEALLLAGVTVIEVKECGEFDQPAHPPTTRVSRVQLFARHLKIVTARTFVQLLRARRVLLVDGLLMVLMSLTVTLIYGDLEPFKHASPHSALTLTIGLTGVSVGLRVFGSDRHIYVRERAAGVQPIPYFAGKIVGNAPLVVLNPLVLALSYCLLVSPRAPLSEYFVAFLLTQWAAMSVGIFASLAFRRKIALSVSVLYILIAFLCNSVTQKQTALESKLGGFGTFLTRVSLLSYGTKTLTLSETVRYSPVWFKGAAVALHGFGFADVNPNVSFVPVGRYEARGAAWMEQCVALFAFGCVLMVLGGVLISTATMSSLSPSLHAERTRVRVLSRRRLRRKAVGPFEVNAL